MNVNRTQLFQLLLVLLVISSHILFIYIVQRKKDKKRCPGYLDSTFGQCTNNGKHYLSFVKRNESECDPNIYELKRRDIVLYAGKLALQYLTDKRESHLSALHDLFSNMGDDVVVYQGIFYFLLKPFLTVLPTDFGQNYITPYGTPSFLADYVSCIPDISVVCADLIKDPDHQETCQRYFQDLEKNFSNPKRIPNCIVTETGLYDNPLYVELGLLGAMTISPTQAIVLSGTIPARLGLKYWSFTPYLADRYDKDDTCTPFHNIYFSSLTDPFNNFTHHTDTGDLTFAIIITINKIVGDEMETYLHDNLVKDNNKLDYIHRFDLPSGPDSMIIQPDLLNPNGLTNKDAAFNYKTDRLAILFRMNVKDPYSTAFEEFKLNPHFESYCVDYLDTNVEFYSGIHPPLKTPCPLQTDESFLRDKFNGVKKLLETSFRDTFSSHPIHGFDSLLGTFAPLDSRVYNNEFMYDNGRQAIQMASNANGDNPDTWYKLSQPQCVSMDDILVCVCVNHTALKNSIYCNINILDKQMGRGIGSVQIFEDDEELLKYPFYSVMISRNKELLATFKQEFSSLFGQDIYVYDYLVDTGDTMHWSVPMCHQLLFIERAYLNPTVEVNGEFKYYHDVGPEEWGRMTRPDGKQLLHPIFMKFTKTSSTNIWFIFMIVLILFLILWILVFAKMNIFKF